MKQLLAVMLISQDIKWSIELEGVALFQPFEVISLVVASRRKLYFQSGAWCPFKAPASLISLFANRVMELHYL